MEKVLDLGRVDPGPAAQLGRRQQHRESLGRLLLALGLAGELRDHLAQVSLLFAGAERRRGRSGDRRLRGRDRVGLARRRCVAPFPFVDRSEAQLVRLVAPAALGYLLGDLPLQLGDLVPVAVARGDAA